MDRTVAKHDLQTLQLSVPSGSVIVASTGTGPFEQLLLDGRHALRADEPVAVGGGDAGPGPYELLVMALGSCTSMTVNLYAARKNWTLDQVIVRLRHERVHADGCANCEDPNSKIDRILCSIELVGPLDEAQRNQLIEIQRSAPYTAHLRTRSRSAQTSSHSELQAMPIAASQPEDGCRDIFLGSHVNRGRELQGIGGPFRCP